MKQKLWAYFYLLCANKDTHNTCTVYRHWFDHKSINSSPNSILSCHACLMKYKYEWNAETDTWSSHSGQDNPTEQFIIYIVLVFIKFDILDITTWKRFALITH